MDLITAHKEFFEARSMLSQTILEISTKILLQKLLDSAMAAGTAQFKKLAAYKHLSFERHFDVAFERCTKVKTIVNGDKPIDLLQYYVAPDFRQNCRELSDAQFVDAIWGQKRIVLVGAAGSGKSMFMRFFWISCA